MTADPWYPLPQAPRPSWPSRFAVRFLLLYLTVFWLLAGTGYPLVSYLSDVLIPAADSLAKWAAPNLLNIHADLGEQSGSGDRLINYIEFGGLAIAAAVAALGWSLIARSGRRDRHLLDALTIVIRYGLLSMMMSYGLAKVLPPRQFSEPGVGRLLQPYGESSPMGLLWTFMGASQPYTIMAGSLELLGGLLMVCRRTVLLGAFVTLAVMGNIVALNLCYDVPVKLHSLHYLVQAFLLTLPHCRRLANLFVLNRPAPAADLAMPLAGLSPRVANWARWILWTIKAVLLSVFLWSRLSNYVTMKYPYSQSGPLDGGYEIERFERDGEVLPPLVSDARRWRTLAIHQSTYLGVRTMTSSRLDFELRIDADNGAFVLTPQRPPGRATTWKYLQTERGLELEGTFEDRAIKIVAKKRTADDFLLMNRGFHWISEVPYNR